MKVFKKIIIFILVLLLIYSSSIAVMATEIVPLRLPGADFLDVSTSHWAYDAIMEVTDNGILDRGGSYFYPNEYVTRGEAVKALYQFIHAMPAPSSASMPFTDVSSDYSTYVKWAYYKDITNGATATTFAPDRNVIKQDMCVLIANTYLAYGIYFSQARNYSNFEDNSSISSYAKSAVRALYQQYIVNGDTHGNFNPTSKITRAMFAMMLHQLYEYIYFCSITPVQQRENWGWCWAACASMVGSYGVMEPPKSQYSIVQYIKGWEENEGGSLEEIADGARYASNFTKYFDISYFEQTMGQVYLKTKRNIPIITTGISVQDSNVAHAMVVFGYSYTDTESYVIYCNPQSGRIDCEKHAEYVDGSGTGYKWDESIFEEVT